MKVLLLGYGNPGRGDDGLGPALVEALAGKFPGVDGLAAMQLQPEHSLDLQACDRVLLADAGVNIPPPFTFERIQPRYDVSFSTHALSPWTLLAIYRDTFGKAPPPTFLLTLRGERFGLGEGFSPQARKNLRRALDFAATWLTDARAVPG